MALSAGQWRTHDQDLASKFLATGRVETRRIGQSLDRLGGFSAMSAVHKALAGYLHPSARRELSVCWHKLGDRLDRA